MKPEGQRRAAIDSGSGTRRRLVDAAAELIASEGVAAASSRAITERAGENLAAITYYFGSKQALVTEALVVRARSLIEPVLAALDGDAPSVQRMLDAVTAITSLFARHRDELPAFVECIAASTRDGELATELASLFRHIEDLLAGDMVRQRAEGRIPEWVDPAAMAQLIVAVANGVIVRDVVDRRYSQPGDVGQQFATLLASVAT